MDYEDISFFDFAKYSDIQNLLISNDISELALNFDDEKTSLWFSNPVDLDGIEDSPTAFVVNNMSYAIHPDLLAGLTTLLSIDESIYLVHHHERGDIGYDDLMMEIKRDSWVCHLRGFEGDIIEHRIFDFNKSRNETKGKFNPSFIEETLKINKNLLITDGVDFSYLDGHDDIDDLDLEKA